MRVSRLLALLGLLGLAVEAPAAPRPAAGALAFAAQSVSVGKELRRIATGDLDGDGDPDIMVLGRDASSWQLTVLLNGGAHGFAPGWTDGGAVTSSSQRLDLELADREPDGDLDAFVILFASPRVHLNAGDATFSQLDFIPGFASRGEQECADLDGDADMDLVYYELDVIPYLGSLQNTGSSWAFDIAKETSFAGSYDHAVRMALADLVGDGQPDALLASPDSKGLQHVRAKPVPSETPKWGPGAQTLLTVPCRDVAAGDLDGDGDDDAVVSANQPDAVRVLLGQQGPPSVTLFRAGPQPDALVLADLDADGALDVAVTNASATTLAVLLGNGAGSLARPIFVPAGDDPSGLAAADFDGDGDTDLAVAGGVTGEVVLLENLLVP